MRSLIQLSRPQDLFDVVKIVQSKAVPISRRNVLSVFLQKTLFKDIPEVGREELLAEEKFQSVSASWLETIVCSSTAMIVVANAIALFRDFVTALFQPELLGELRIRVMPVPAYLSRIPSAIRETIIQAGRSRRLIRLRYKSLDRNVEPYSFKYKVRTDGRGAEYLYGYDRTRGHTIKSFFLHRVQAVSIVPHEFQPRWVVEF